MCHSFVLEFLIPRETEEEWSRRKRASVYPSDDIVVVFDRSSTSGYHRTAFDE